MEHHGRGRQCACTGGAAGIPHGGASWGFLELKSQAAHGKGRGSGLDFLSLDLHVLTLQDLCSIDFSALDFYPRLVILIAGFQGF